MHGMILPGDGDGEHPLPGPGMPFRGWTEGRPQESAGVRCAGRCGIRSRYRPRQRFQSSIPTTLGILLRPLLYKATVCMSKSPGGPE
jgi:hypothetical protein